MLDTIGRVDKRPGVHGVMVIASDIAAYGFANQGWNSGLLIFAINAYEY
jgi:hypothetical protein